MKAELIPAASKYSAQIQKIYPQSAVAEDLQPAI
jgi:hypothetical protein